MSVGIGPCPDCGSPDHGHAGSVAGLCNNPLAKIRELLRICKEVEVPGLRAAAKDPNCLQPNAPPAYWEGRAEGMERMIEILELTLGQ